VNAVMNCRITYKVRNVGSLGERGGHARFWWGNLREADHLEDLGVDGEIILKCIFKKYDGETWVDCGLL